ncbi:MAG: Dabb family protein [Chloroflexi bacterium]|nr:Dabb family protein [Chloroflexota bacterium]
MIRHVVLMKLQENDPGALESGLEALRKLPDQVPEAINFTVGRNVCDRDQSFSHCVGVDFESLATLDRYLKHPAHVAAVQLLAPLLEAKIVADYEI